jgi:hypothetical protein
MTEQELNEIDGALWGLSVVDNGQVEIETTIYRFTDKTTPRNEDLESYCYYVLTYKADDPKNIELIRANIGDVKFFIDNHAKAGYNGLMVKEGCVPKKTVKDLIRVVFKNCQLPEKSLKPILAQV